MALGSWRVVRLGGVIDIAADKGKGQRERMPRPMLLDVDEADRMPYEVLLATHPGRSVGERVMLELRESVNDQLVVMAYSSRQALVECCGRGQSWIRVPAHELPNLKRSAGFKAVALDTPLPVETRHPATPEGQEEPTPFATLGDDEDRMLFVPSRPFHEGHKRAELELQPISDDEVALLAYSSLELLIWGCGEHQAWVSFPSSDIEEVRRQSGADVVVMDTALPEWLRHGQY
ncbi:hypothetical protein EV193_11795 [Herbihabitans rhizosphaerae]|uniref:Type III secretion system (T3SS) SseB-like protein n=1 Tax=Herbihabitans rhizosphaerae TaxID=1872711 RepID=A0A4Q7KBR0_9PSEU|nr:hypothetical protein EV193_11795 [Herbihabitans rhizosphaerae]